MSNRPKFLAGEIAYCRFTGEGFPVVFCDGCIAVLRAPDGSTFARTAGELSSRAPELVGAD